MTGRIAPDDVMEHRREVVDGEPIQTFERRVVDHSGSLQVNVPSVAVSILGITPGDELDLGIYRNRYVLGEREDGDPLFVAEGQSVVDHGGLYVSPSAEGVAVLGIEQGDDVPVDVYDTRVVVRAGERS